MSFAPPLPRKNLVLLYGRELGKPTLIPTALELETLLNGLKRRNVKFSNAKLVERWELFGLDYNTTYISHTEEQRFREEERYG
jgi:hypothetical protein